VDTSHFGLTLMTVNGTHLTLTLYSDEEGGGGPRFIHIVGEGGVGGRAGSSGGDEGVRRRGGREGCR